MLLCSNTCCWGDEVDLRAFSALCHLQLLLWEGAGSNAHGEAILHQRKERGEADNTSATPNGSYLLGVIVTTQYHQSPQNLKQWFIVTQYREVT